MSATDEEHRNSCAVVSVKPNLGRGEITGLKWALPVGQAPDRLVSMEWLWIRIGWVNDSRSKSSSSPRSEAPMMLTVSDCLNGKRSIRLPQGSKISIVVFKSLR